MKKLSMTAAVCFSLLTAYPIYAQTETLEHECTSWIVFSDLTENNTNILHKNRDSKKRQIAVYLSPADSPRKWVGQGNPGSPANMAINTSGLAGVMNSGEKCINHSTDSTTANWIFISYIPAALQ